VSCHEGELVLGSKTAGPKQQIPFASMTLWLSAQPGVIRFVLEAEK